MNIAQQHWNLTPEAKAQLRRALNQYIDTLCFSEDVHKQIKYGVCKRVGKYDYKRSPTYNKGEYLKKNNNKNQIVAIIV